MAGFKELSYFLEGRLISVERFEDETDPMYAEKASFILDFRHDAEKFVLAKLLASYHIQKMFSGAVFKPEYEQALQQLRVARSSLTTMN